MCAVSEHHAAKFAQCRSKSECTILTAAPLLARSGAILALCCLTEGRQKVELLSFKEVVMPVWLKSAQARLGLPWPE